MFSCLSIEQYNSYLFLDSVANVSYAMDSVHANSSTLGFA